MVNANLQCGAIDKPAISAPFLAMTWRPFNMPMQLCSFMLNAEEEDLLGAHGVVCKGVCHQSNQRAGARAASGRCLVLDIQDLGNAAS